MSSIKDRIAMFSKPAATGNAPGNAPGIAPKGFNGAGIRSGQSSHMTPPGSAPVSTPAPAPVTAPASASTNNTISGSTTNISSSEMSDIKASGVNNSSNAPKILPIGANGAGIRSMQGSHLFKLPTNNTPANNKNDTSQESATTTVFTASDTATATMSAQNNVQSDPTSIGNRRISLKLEGLIGGLNIKPNQSERSKAEIAPQHCNDSNHSLESLEPSSTSDERKLKHVSYIIYKMQLG
jgi:hypothetical protein